MPTFYEYLPMDRRQALLGGEELPDRAEGAALFADISGFTALTEALAAELGPQRGAEELSKQLNLVFAALINQIHRYHGSVIGFSGDSITCWFDRLPGETPALEAARLRALSCGLAIQASMEPLHAVTTPAGSQVELAVKVAVAAGPVRRFLVGNPGIQHIDVLAGSTMDMLAATEAAAQRGEVALALDESGAIPEGVMAVEYRPMKIDPAPPVRSSPSGATKPHRTGNPPGRQVAVVGGLSMLAAPQPWIESVSGESVSGEIASGGSREEGFTSAHAWLLPAVYERLERTGDRFLAELRPVASLFLAFSGIDYDEDEDAGLLLDAYIRRVQAVVARYEGALVGITMGDKGSYLFISFGAPIAHDDDPIRAVAAALDLQAQSAALGYIQPVRIGSTYGQAYAGAYGSQDRRTYDILGDKVNLAARLMQHAAPGEILCDEDIYRLGRTRWAFEPLLPIRVKGKAGLIRPFRPTGESSLAQAKEPALLVGRQGELDRIEATLEGLQTGTGRVSIVQGEAGIGKSRLVAELVRRLRERGLAGLLGAGQSTEQGTPYRAWRNIFSSFFDIDEVSDLEERRQRVRSVVHEIAPKLAGRLPLLNDVLHLELPDTPLTAALDPALRRESLTGLLVALLQTWARERPLVLVLEDAHWLDSLSWDLALKVARALLSSGQPLLLVLVTRPVDEPHQQLEALRDLEWSETLVLSGLDAPYLEALAAERLGLPPGELPKTVAALVTERASGNPFFAEELALNLRDTGLFSVENIAGELHYTVSPQLEQQKSSLPDSIQGLILARIDRLPVERQFTLKVAAAIGQTFTYSPLRAAIDRLAPPTAVSLPAHMQDLARREFTLLKSLEPEKTYIFKHIITQEVAYGTLLSDQRKAIHRTLAEWYESLLETEPGSHPASGSDIGTVPKAEIDPAVLLPLLVYHFHHAEQREKERLYAQQAGERAAQTFALEEAIAYLSRALELTAESNLAERFDLLLQREKMYDLQGDRQAQSADAEALLGLAEVLGNDRRMAEALFRLAELRQVRGDYSGAVDASRQAVELARLQGSHELETEGLIGLGRSLWKMSDYMNGRELLERALRLSRANGWLDKEAAALSNLGVIADLTGDRAMAQAHFEGALDIHQQLKNRIGEARAYNSLGVVAWRRGDLASAQTCFERSVQMAREIGSPSNELYPLANLAMVANGRANPIQAAEFARQGLALARLTGETYAESRALGLLGNAYNALGRYLEALDTYQQALAVTRACGDRQDEIYKLHSLGYTSFLLGNLNAADAYFTEALDKALEIGDRDAERDINNGLCLLYHYLDDQAKAAQHGERSLAIAREISDAAEQGVILTNLGHVHLALGELDSANQAYREAVDLLQSAGNDDPAFGARAGLVNLALAQGAPERALAEAEAILADPQVEKLNTSDEPARLYLAIALALQTGKDPRLERILKTGYDLLMERAAALDPDTRQQYLGNVPPNRDLVKLAELVIGANAKSNFAR